MTQKKRHPFGCLFFLPAKEPFGSLADKFSLRFGALLSPCRQLRHVAPREVYFATYTPQQNMIQIVCRLRAAKFATLFVYKAGEIVYNK